MSENHPAIADLKRQISRFDPSQTAISLAKADAVIAYCAEMRDWPALEQAVGLKIEEQAGFVAWWDGAVRRPGNQPNILGRGYLAAAEAADHTRIRPQQVSIWRKALGDRDRYFSKVVCAACRAAGLEPPENHRAQGTGDNEWFTPARYIEAARAVMGDIDLDPATHELAQQTIGAAQFFTLADNGLQHDWRGRVWLNPPYTQPHIELFINKLCAEIAAGRTTEAIALTHNYTDTAWFHIAANAAPLICFTQGRIKFIDSDGGTCAPTQGQAFFYFGEHLDEFRAVFSAFGMVRGR